MSSDAGNAVPVKRGRTRRERNDDPTNPANEGKALAALGPQEVDALEDFELDVVDMGNHAVRVPLWDSQLFAAIGIGMLLGSIAGIPIGIYLYYNP